MQEFSKSRPVLFVLAIGLAVSMVFCSFTVPWCVYHTTVMSEAMRNGYEQGAVPGMSGVHWVKKKACGCACGADCKCEGGCCKK